MSKLSSQSGTYSIITGASISTVCVNCGAGTYSNGAVSVCANCEVGTYQASTGATSCNGCVAGYYLASTGSTSSASCMVFQFQQQPDVRREDDLFFYLQVSSLFYFYRHVRLDATSRPLVLQVVSSARWDMSLQPPQS